MILPDFASAADDMTLLRRLLPLTPVQAPMPINNDTLHHWRDDMHRLIGNVMRMREGLTDGTQTRATALATINTAQGCLEMLSAELISARCEVIRAFAEPLCAKTAPTFHPSPDAGFSGFASPAGA